MYENSELNVLKNIFFGEISGNCPNDLLGTDIYNTLKFCSFSNLLILLQWFQNEAHFHRFDL